MKPFHFIVPALLFALAPCSLFPQDHDSWDIGTYDPPDYTYRELIIVPELSINNTDSTHKSTNSLTSEKETTLFSSNRYAISPSHRFHLYTKKIEFGSHNFMNIASDAIPFSKTESDNFLADSKDFYRDRDFTLTIESQDSGRLYFPSGAFLGAQAGFGFAMENRNSFSGSAINSKNDTPVTIAYSKRSVSIEMTNPSASLFIGAGWGRIRDVTFGAVALNMLDRINEVLPNSTGIPADGVQDFAAFIEKRRRLRAFDDRLAFIGNIDTLCRYLIDKRAISGPGSAVTMELADQWLYAFAQNRLAGLAFSLYPGIMVNTSRHAISDNASWWHDSLDYDVRLIDADLDNARNGWGYRETSDRLHQYQTELTYCLNSTIQAAKPISRFFQVNGQVDFNFHWNHYFARSVPSDAAEVDYETLLPLLEAEASCLFAYYPDTRTTFTFGPTISYDRSYNYLINENKNHGTTMIFVKNDLRFDFRRTSLEFPLNLMYYVSPRMHYRVSAATYLRSYYSSDQAVTKGWYSTYAVAAGLTYQLF